MAQQSLSDQMMGGKVAGYQYTDTTYTKIFVGGLAWETRREHMKHYFEQFGAIEEAVVITEKSTGRSKGYGFVTFKDPNAAMRACQNPYPVIDGRRTNCNLAYLGANRTAPSTPQYYGKGSFRPPTPPPASMAPPSYEGSSMAYLQQQLAYYAFPYSSYGYNGCSQDNMLPMQIYPSGGQQFPNYYLMSATSIMPRISPNSYALYAQFAQSDQVQGYEIKYPSMVQYAYIPQPYSTSVFLPALPSSTSVTNTASVLGGIESVPRDTKAAPGTISNQNSSV